MSDLVKAATQQRFTEEEKNLLKTQVCPQGCTDLEFAYFVRQCERTGLDPFIKQAYMIERSAAVTDQYGRDKWVKKFEFTAAESGMLAKCDLQPDFRGIRGAFVCEGDDIVIDEPAGTVKHSYSPAKRGKLLGAWAQGFREGREVPIVWLPLETRIQKKKDGTPTKFWANDPSGQILKCARAGVERLMYPNLFEKVYIEGELPEVEASDSLPTEELPAVSRVDELKAKLGVQATPLSLIGKDPSKVADYDLETLTRAIQEGEQKLIAGPPDAKWIPKLKAAMDAIANEVMKREADAAGRAVEGKVVSP